jgi:iron-sulfur cluster repair protein YtfE (RIC family)
MNQMETGLRHRLRRAVRQMVSQHEHLRTLTQAVADATEAGQVAVIQESVDRLRGAIESHFSLEDDVFFPAVHGLHSESASELHALMRDHVDFLDELVGLREGLATGAVDGFAKGYRAFCKSLAEHEIREERLIASLADVIDAIR